MDDASKAEIRAIVDAALQESREHLLDGFHDLLAKKFEITFGIDCRSVEERQETRKDMEFLRVLRHDEDDVRANMSFITDLRGHARSAGEKVAFSLLTVAATILGTGALYFLISTVFPGADKYFHK
jgi:hypothetical protein